MEIVVWGQRQTRTSALNIINWLPTPTRDSERLLYWIRFECVFMSQWLQFIDYVLAWEVMDNKYECTKCDVIQANTYSEITPFIEWKAPLTFWPKNLWIINNYTMYQVWCCSYEYTLTEIKMENRRYILKTIRYESSIVVMASLLS